MKGKMDNGKWTMDNGQWTMDDGDILSSLDRYLAGEQPLQTERIGLPSDEELDAAEAEFDRIAAERKSPGRRIMRWWPLAATAAVLVLVFIAISNQLKGPSDTLPSPLIKERAVSIDDSHRSSSQTAFASAHEDDSKAELTAQTAQPAKESSIASTQPSKATAPSLTGKAGGESSSATSDSLRYYLARLEAEMQIVDDSEAREHLEQLIATDVQLQQLVQRIVHAEVETAMNTVSADSTANYLNF